MLGFWPQNLCVSLQRGANSAFRQGETAQIVLFFSFSARGLDQGRLVSYEVAWLFNEESFVENLFLGRDGENPRRFLEGC